MVRVRSSVVLPALRWTDFCDLLFGNYFVNQLQKYSIEYWLFSAKYSSDNTGHFTIFSWALLPHGHWPDSGLIVLLETLLGIS
jgi:hypothetical protein